MEEVEARSGAAADSRLRWKAGTSKVGVARACLATSGRSGIVERRSMKYDD